MNKFIIKTASILFPGLMTKVAYYKVTNPQVVKLREHELKVLDKAEKITYKFKDFKIQTYSWGTPGAEKVLLIHGWEGQAGNFADIIDRLVEEGYHVYAFDGPSHGFSSRGKTSMFEFTDLVGELLRKYSFNRLISHSFGGVATTFALSKNQDINILRYVLLTTPDKFGDRINDVKESIGITEHVKGKLIDKLEAEMQIEVSSVSVSEFVKKVNVDKALIIHDKNDRIIPISQSRNVQRNWQNCEFQEIEGTGHYRILRTESVLDHVVEFIK